MDAGIGSISRIDYPEIHGNTLILIHPHVNDEVLSYFRTGKAEHTDLEGLEKTIGSETPLLVKAGKSFFQERQSAYSSRWKPYRFLSALARRTLEPEVIFLDLDECLNLGV